MNPKPHMIIIGTSGSHDYLRDPNGQKRFWPVHVPLPTVEAAAQNREDLGTHEHDESGEARPDDPTKMEY